MSLEKPGKARARIDDQGGILKVIIPVKRNTFIILFLCAWMVGWVFGEFSAIAELTSGDGGVGIDIFMTAWLVGWTIGGVFVFLIIAWNMTGLEVITLSTGILKIEKRILLFGISRIYSLSDAVRFRVQAGGSSILEWRGMGFWWTGSGKLVFDYGMKTVRFAGGIDEAEASYILELFKQKGVKV